MRALLLFAVLSGTGLAQPACENTEPFFGGGRIQEFCVFPEFPNEETEIFARFVTVTISSNQFDNLEFEVDGNVIRLAGWPFSFPSPTEIGPPVENFVSLGYFPEGDYVLEFYADIDLYLIAGGGVVPPDAVRNFTVAPAPRDVPTLQWWGVLLLIAGVGLIAPRWWREA